MRLLNPGNIVTVGFQIYRSRFKSYLIISLIAHLWLLIPLLGWAKFFANSALISRLVFQEITGKPELWQSAQKQVNRKLFGFLLSALIVAVVIYISYSFLLIVIVILGIKIFEFLHSSLYASIPKTGLPGMLISLSYILVIILLFLLFITAIISVYSQFFITEVILAVEDKVNMWEALKKSNKLTSNSGFRPSLIIAITALLCWPFYLLSQIILGGLNFGLTYFKINDFPLSIILGIGLLGLINIFLLPFWQVVKAVLYYDIQNRREGLALLTRRKTH